MSVLERPKIVSTEYKEGWGNSVDAGDALSLNRSTLFRFNKALQVRSTQV
jgi:hypothetical protein